MTYTLADLVSELRDISIEIERHAFYRDQNAHRGELLRRARVLREAMTIIQKHEIESK